MTTFTKLSDGEKPVIEVDAGKKLSKVDDMVYGGFTEYVLYLFHTCSQAQTLALKKMTTVVMYRGRLKTLG